MAPENVISIWTQMGYVPPRGPCSNGKTMLSSGCSCQRFMAHPLKMASSFECDGCGHHASFHKMDNPVDDAAIKRLQEIQRDQYSQEESTGSRKRPRRAIENGSGTANQLRNMPAGPSSTKAERQAAWKPMRTSHKRRPNQLDGDDVSGRVYEILE